MLATRRHVGVAADPDEGAVATFIERRHRQVVSSPVIWRLAVACRPRTCSTNTDKWAVALIAGHCRPSYPYERTVPLHDAVRDAGSADAHERAWCSPADRRQRGWLVSCPGESLAFSGTPVTEDRPTWTHLQHALVISSLKHRRWWMGRCRQAQRHRRRAAKTTMTDGGGGVSYGSRSLLM